MNLRHHKRTSTATIVATEADAPVVASTLRLDHVDAVRCCGPFPPHLWLRGEVVGSSPEVVIGVPDIDLQARRVVLRLEAQAPSEAEPHRARPFDCKVALSSLYGKGGAWTIDVIGRDGRLLGRAKLDNLAPL